MRSFQGGSSYPRSQVAQDNYLAIEHLAVSEDREAPFLAVDMIDLDKLASDIVGAIWDDYEDEKIVTRSRWEEIVKKAAKRHLDKVVTPPGGFGVGAFMAPEGSDHRPGAITWIDGAASDRLSDLMKVNVRKWFRIDHPLLPDED